MDVIRSARLRRHWPVFATLAVFLLFGAAQLFVYAPVAKRYAMALRGAGTLGAILDPSMGAMPSAMPPRVYSLFMENSAPALEVDRRAQAGGLGAELVQQLSSLANVQHLDVVVAEPGAVTQQPAWAVARAHLRMRGTWGRYLAFLDAVAHSGRLITIERFSLTPGNGGTCDIEVWVAGATLKRRRPAS
jgi:hypothetical protein